MSKDLRKMRRESGEESRLLRFPDGLLGFEDVKEYVLQRQGNSPVWELYPAERDYPRFILFAADNVVTDYRPEISRETIIGLQVQGRDELTFFVIAVVSGDIKRTTVNLRSPIAVNYRAGLAAQVITENAEYPMRHPIFAADWRLD